LFNEGFDGLILREAMASPASGSAMVCCDTNDTSRFASDIETIRKAPILLSSTQAKEDIFMSIETESNMSEWSKSSLSTTPLLWHAFLAAVVFIAIVVLIATQPQSEAIDYLAGNAFPL